MSTTTETQEDQILKLKKKIFEIKQKVKKAGETEEEFIIKWAEELKKLIKLGAYEYEEY